MAQPASVKKPEAIRALYQSHGDRLFRIALRVSGGRRSFAEDVVQDVFEKLIQHYDSLADQDDLGAWLYRVAMNKSLTKLRRESFRSSPLVRLFIGDTAPASPSADVAARLSASQREALDALAVLPPRERLAFSMVHLDEAPLKDVARALGCSTSYACKLAQRAEDLLARHGWKKSPARTPADPVIEFDRDFEGEVSVG